MFAAEGVPFVLVGSAGLRLHGFDIPVGDADIVPDLDPSSLAVLCETVARYQDRAGVGPSPSRLLASDVWTSMTCYGKLDVLVDRAHWDAEVLRQRASSIRVLDVNVVVASAKDTWALRHRFKTDPPAAEAISR